VVTGWRLLVCLGAGIAAGGAILVVAAAVGLGDRATYFAAGAALVGGDWVVDRLAPGERLRSRPLVSNLEWAAVFAVFVGVWWTLTDEVRAQVGPGWAAPAYFVVTVPCYVGLTIVLHVLSARKADP